MKEEPTPDMANMKSNGNGAAGDEADLAPPPAEEQEASPDRQHPKIEKPSDLTSYFLGFILKRKWTAIFLFLVGVGLAAIGTYLCTPLHTASVKILVQYNVSQEIVLFGDLGYPVVKGQNVLPANNFVQMALSSQLARTIVDQFKLDEHLRREREEPKDFRESVWASVRRTKDWIKDAVKTPYSKYKESRGSVLPEKKPPDYRTKAINELREEMLEVELVADSDVIALTVWARTPEQAQSMAMAVTEQVIEQSVALEQSAAGEGYKLCDRELKRVQQQLREAEAALETFKRVHGIWDHSRQRQIKLDALQKVYSDIVTLEASLVASEGRREQGREQIEEQATKLSSRDSYQALLAESVMIDVDIVGTQQSLDRQRESMKQIEAELDVLVGNEAELMRLQRDLDQKEQRFLELSQKRDELDAQSVSRLSAINMRIIDTPDLSKDAEADWPDWELNMIIGILASVFLAIGIPVFQGLWHDPFWLSDDSPEITP